MHAETAEVGASAPPGRGLPTEVSARTVAWFLERLPLLETENEALRARSRELEAHARDATGRAEALERELRDLRARLAFYENPNTPPSQRRLPAEPPASPLLTPVEPRKRGAPVGHRGATRVPPPPDEVVAVRAEACPRCGRPVGAPARVEARTITELPPPQAVRVTRYEVGCYACAGCGHEYAATHPELPSRGQWGPHLLTYMTMLKHHVRGPVRRVADVLAHRENLPITPKGVHDALLRVAETCQTEYARIATRVRDAPYVHADETSIKVNGEPRWLWAFRTPDGDVLTVIRDSRARDVVTEILGDHPQPLVVDGHGAYRSAREIQRCWSHLLREADAVRTASPAGQALAEALHDAYRRLKEHAAATLPPTEAAHHKEQLDHELAALVAKHDGDPAIRKAVTYLRGGLGSWTTCLLHPGMPPTNNLAEQALREHVVVRKLIGTFRSEHGAEAYQWIASLLISWRLQGKNPFVELHALLTRELCGA